MTENKRDSMVFFASYYEAAKNLDDATFKTFISTVMEYGIYGTEPKNLDPISNMAFLLMRPSIDNAKARYENAVENGKRGGAPLGNKNRKKADASTNIQPNSTNIQPNSTNIQPNSTNIQPNSTDFQPNSTDFQPNSTENNLTVSDTDTDTDTDTYTYTDTESEYDSVTNSEAYTDNKDVSVNVCVNENPPTPTAVLGGTHKIARGEYNNVYITTIEMAKLINELGMDKYLQSIEFLSGYITRKPNYKSANHYEDLRGWVQQALTDRGLVPSKEEEAKMEKYKQSGFDIDFEDIFERP